MVAMPLFKAVLFDIDGTLLDTSEFIFQAYEHTLGAHGLSQAGRTGIASLIGKPLDTCYRMLTGLNDVTELCASHRAFQMAHLDLALAYPGARTTLEMLAAAGVRIAAITTRSGATATTTLELTGIAPYVEYVVALEDVEHLKPHPEPLYKALDYLAVGPEHAAMVGDTDVDVLAGKNAGATTVGVTYGFHGKRIADSEPDYLIDDIRELAPIVLALV